MKRTFLRGGGVRSNDPFHNLTQDQLAYIGAITMVFNDGEEVIDALCATALKVPIRQEELLSRINGIEGKFALIKLGAKHWGLTDEEMNGLTEALGQSGFHGLKKWRDAVIHSRMLDMQRAVARVHERQGRISEVLLSLDALKGLYHRLDHIRNELRHYLNILYRRSLLNGAATGPQNREELQRGISALWARAQESRTQRQSLPPMPEFPDEPPAPGQQR